jgi:hypothetical protein
VLSSAERVHETIPRMIFPAWYLLVSKLGYAEDLFFNICFCLGHISPILNYIFAKYQLYCRAPVELAQGFAVLLFSFAYNTTQGDSPP